MYFGEVQQKHVLGDPAVGYEFMDEDRLLTLWTGIGLRFGHYDNNGNPVP